MNASEQFSEGGPRLQVAFDRPVVSVRGSSVRYLIAEVEAPPAPAAESERLPLNLALVADASGSMAGPPLETARAAAQQVVAGLDPADQLRGELRQYDHDAPAGREARRRRACARRRGPG